jgi:putative FmdB family regulatory protein
MPIYEYECEKCHHQLEALQKISDKPLRECPECGRHALKRLVSAPLFRLAGSGWYETDFKSDKEAKRNLAGKEETPVAEPAKDATASDKKPAESKPAEVKPVAETPRKAMVTKPATSRPASKPKAKAPAKRTAAKKTGQRR